LVQLVPLLRLAPYDRNPTSPSVLFGLVGPTGPHGTTVRFTYTVPTRRIAIINSVQLRFRRATAATTPLTLLATILRNGLNYENLSTQSNGLDIDRTLQTSPQTPMLTGQALVGQDSDGSIGGTVEYLETATVTEFDA
jgi:hypothetical protein